MIARCRWTSCASCSRQAQDAARSFESAVNEAGRNVEAEAAKVQGSVNTSLAEAEAAAAKPVENTIAPAQHAALSAQDEVQALERSIAEQAQSASSPAFRYHRHLRRRSRQSR